MGKRKSHSTVRMSKVPKITHISLEEDALSQPQQEGKHCSCYLKFLGREVNVIINSGLL